MSAVRVFVSSPDTRSERRFELSTTIGALKSKLELITGIPEASQRLELHTANKEDGPALAVLDDDARMLGYYSVHDLQVLKVIDTNPSISFTGQLHDTTGVDKFELTSEEYAQRQDSVMAYKQRNKLGRFAEPKDEPASVTPVPANMSIGARCQVESSEPGLHKRGTVRFVGSTTFASGAWVGVEYDEPMGKNDGSVQGEKYFACKPNYGVFVRPEKVTVGDYPVINDLEDDLEEM